MESHKALKEAFESSSPKVIAAELGVSLSLVYKWSQQQSETGSGSRNPLDRVVELYKITNCKRILEYICEECDGYFVPNPAHQNKQDYKVLPATNEIVVQFSNLLARISSAALDNSIDNSEAEEIRQSWDKLKGYTEGFVRSCEDGDFELLHDKIEAEKKLGQVPEVRKTLY